jgi:pyruvate formate lyase activating enzyme
MLDHHPTPPETLNRARKIALSKGLRYVYTGNIHDKKGGSTYCHSCGKILIERDWYEMGQYNLVENNKCKFCGTECAGRFDREPGTWGSKRLPVRLSGVR